MRRQDRGTREHGTQRQDRGTGKIVERENIEHKGKIQEHGKIVERKNMEHEGKIKEHGHYNYIISTVY